MILSRIDEGPLFVENDDDDDDEPERHAEKCRNCTNENQMEISKRVDGERGFVPTASCCSRDCRGWCPYGHRL